ncbi:hypothetical protein V6N13_033944 [Hibiscus sabdariffa]
MVVFVEPKISGVRADSVISSLGFPNSHRVESRGFSSGIWIAWYKMISVEIIFSHFQFSHCRITHNRDCKSVLATTIYASPTKSYRKLLWPHLRRLAASIRSPWILFGDFNATLKTMERPGCAITTKPSTKFQNLIFDYGLCEMGYLGPDFTWCRGLAQVRLDRFICNCYWDENFPECSVHHLL